MSELDSTVVTGAPSQLRRGPRRGDVLGERYELRRRFDDDGCLTTFLAFDQELEEEILLRSINLHGLKREQVEATLERLRHLRRIGGRYLCQLREVDREGSSIFTVEPMPEGKRFSEMLKRRKSRRLLFSPVELLPVIARIEAGLRAIPTGWYHGDIRTNRIWLSEGGLKLSGSFLLAAVPDEGVDLLLQQHQALRERLPPEFGRRSRGRATDVYCTAALTWEALTGEAPGPDPSAPQSGLDRSLGEVMRRCLRADPQRRLRTLEPLINALAMAAGGVAPTLDAEPVGALSPSAPLPDQGFGQDEEADSQAGTVRVPISGFTPLGLDATEEHRIEQTYEEQRTIPKDEGLDPRFVRAALDVTLEEGSDETELMALPPMGARGGAKGKGQGLHIQTTVELAVDPQQMKEIKAKGMRAKEERRKRKMRMNQDTVETRREQVGMSTEDMLALPERRSSRESGRTQQLPAASRQGSQQGSRQGSRQSSPNPQLAGDQADGRKSLLSGKTIIALAVLIAIMILSAGFLIARERQRSNAQHRAAEQRLQEIQQSD